MTNGSTFAEWVNSIDDQTAFADLADAVVGKMLQDMPLDVVGDYINTMADSLNNRGYDWGAFRVDNEVRND